MVVTRFAPSPTGYLHIGGLRTALYSYLWAKRKGGKFLLRIEDTDLKRNSQEATEAIVEAFKWVGLSHDGEVFYQSKRFDIYKKYVQQLLDEGKAYYCYMSSEEKNELYEKQKANKQRTKYDGRYRDFEGTPPEGVEPVVRIKSPLSGEISFIDGIKGEIKFNVEDILDDFVIARGDGTPLYNFVVAIDDALMGVTEVIRGDDHISNTPKQIVVYKALGFDIPKFYHVPMILNPSGKKLSKRDGAMDVMEYKKDGFLPEALLNFLIRLGWSHGDQELFSFEEMSELFDPNDINKSASAYNAEKLLWINSQYIKTASTQRLVEVLKDYDLDLSGFEKTEELLGLLRDRAKDMNELKQMISSIINKPTQYEQKAVDKFLKGDALDILEAFNKELKSKGEVTLTDEFKEVANNFLESKGLKLKHLAQPIRIAIVGSAVSPSVFDVLSIVGYNEVVQRIDNLIKNQKGLERE
ncbi:glutamate--tRNA ligase [Sulfurospirillum arcachonense]|uniref:glutamate--tRNA ligase n=1 Tax=Sulfurospirillum arcachonense TaxID=57666 RepID=UPI0004688624|nr:glutamate--tRNA ligase [Sulfurospirillum arcachonense]